MRLNYFTLLTPLLALVLSAGKLQAQESTPPPSMTQANTVQTQAVELPLRDPASALVNPGTIQAAERTPPGVDYQAITPRPIFDLVMNMAPEFMVEPRLVLAIIAAESNFNSQARSRGNAQGLMQLAPVTRRLLNVKNGFDPAQNIRAGMTHLRWLLAYFEGDVALVAAAYNAGTGSVARYQGVPPFPRTQAYVKKMLAAVGSAKHPFDASITRAAGTPTAKRP